MMIYPAMDLLDGQVVRLHQGDFNQKTVYDTDPYRLLNRWADCGVQRVHLVDLDASRNRAPSTALITQIISDFSMDFQVGGGVRSAETLKYWLDAGAHRVVMGSFAVQYPDQTKQLIKSYGSSSLVIGCDVIPMNGNWYVAIEGWTKHTSVSLRNLIENYADDEDLVFLVTDISKDGTCLGMSDGVYHQLRDFRDKEPHRELKFLVSGGVSGMEDIKRAQELGAYGCIVGKSLYEGVLSIEEILSC